MQLSLVLVSDVVGNNEYRFSRDDAYIILVRAPAIKKMVICGQRVAEITFIPLPEEQTGSLKTKVWSFLVLQKGLKCKVSMATRNAILKNGR